MIKSAKQFARNWLVPAKVWQLLANVGKSQQNSQPLLSHEKIVLLKRNQLLKDRHAGERCFILGAGSSINRQNIRVLAGEFVISVSNTFVHPDFSHIRPRYHALPPLLKYHGELHTEAKFVEWLRAMDTATGDAEMILHIGDQEMVYRNGLFKNRIIHWVEYADKWDGNFDTPINMACVPPIGSVSELALTVAVYLGFEKIYLIGIDHDWFNGVHVYFYDHTKEHELRPSQSDVTFADSEFQMRRHADIFRKYKYLNSFGANIFNANANHRDYLDVFPRIDFESLLKENVVTKLSKDND